MKHFRFIIGLGLILLPVSFATAQNRNADNGKRIFLKDGCYECHGTVGQGGTGPRLAMPAIPLPTITAIVRKGVGGMPPYSSKVLSDAELSDIHAYLESIPAPPPAKSIALLNQ